MTNENHNWDEDRLAELLRTAQHAPLAPDARFLARLREESTAVFQAASNELARTRESEAPAEPGEMRVLSPGASTLQEPRPPETDKSVKTRRKSKMYILAWRALTATAAAAVLAAAWFLGNDSNSITLAKLLDKVEQADSLHLHIETADQARQAEDAKQPGDKQASRAVEAWSARDEKLRVNRADGTYDIARGEKLWQIDEKANRAASGESPYYRAESESLDLLPLMERWPLGPYWRKSARRNTMFISSRPATASVR